MSDNISISIPTKSEYVSVARLTASVLANKIGFDIEEIEDIKVAVGEACNNAVLHGKCNDTYDINFIVSENSFQIEVIDCGNGFKMDEYKAPDLENPKESGLGLFIMKSLMDEVEVKSSDGDGTYIKLIKNL